LCLGLHDVGHFGNATGRGVLRLSSAISVSVWTPTEKEPNRIHLTTCRGGSLVLNEDTLS